MIRHIVLLNPSDVEKVEEVLENLPSLVGQVKGLTNIEIGKDFSNRSKGYSHLFIMDFENETALKEWGPNPLHDPIRNTFTKVAEMIVFDYQI